MITLNMRIIKYGPTAFHVERLDAWDMWREDEVFDNYDDAEAYVISEQGGIVLAFGV